MISFAKQIVRNEKLNYDYLYTIAHVYILYVCIYHMSQGRNIRVQAFGLRKF